MAGAILLVSEKKPIELLREYPARILWADTEKKYMNLLSIELITGVVAGRFSDEWLNVSHLPENVPIILCDADKINENARNLLGMTESTDIEVSDIQTLQSLAGELALSINHFLMNVITVINLELDMLRMDGQIEKTVEKRLDYIEDQIDIIVSTMESLRALKGNNDEDIFPYSVTEETVAFIPLMKDYFMNHGAMIKVIKTGNPGHVKANRTALRILFIASMLFFYHSKAENEKGTITVTLTEKGHDCMIRIECPFSRNISRICNRDYGPGQINEYVNTINKYSAILQTEIESGTDGNMAYIAFRITK